MISIKRCFSPRVHEGHDHQGDSHACENNRFNPRAHEGHDCAMQ